MKGKYTIWLILGAYGIWFAVLSGFEEVFLGKYWKITLALLLGIFSYFLIERLNKK